MSEQMEQCLCAEHWPGKGHPEDCPVRRRIEAAEKRAEDAERDFKAMRIERNQLEWKLADAERELDVAREQVLALKDQAKCSCDYDEPGPCLYHQRQIDRALAASQARERTLREALELVKRWHKHSAGFDAFDNCSVCVALRALAESGEALAQAPEPCCTGIEEGRGHSCQREGTGGPEAPRDITPEEQRATLERLGIRDDVFDDYTGPDRCAPEAPSGCGEEGCRGDCSNLSGPITGGPEAPAAREEEGE